MTAVLRERQMEALTLPDIDDRHVLAAAIKCEAAAIVTWNLADFPVSVVGGHDVEMWTPYELLLRLLEANQDLVIQIMREPQKPAQNC